MIAKRKLGKTGFYVSAFSLGGEATIERTDRAGEAEEIINYALDQGVNYIDTAPAYNNGGSESNIGRVMKYRREKRKIREMMIRILAPGSLYCSSKSQVLSALAIYTSNNIDWTDAFIAAQMIASDLKEIYSYDQDFDRLQELTRITP